MLHMAKDDVSHDKRAKGRIKGSGKVVNPSQKEVPLRKYLSTKVNQLCIQRKNKKFKSDVTNKGQEVLLNKHQMITSKDGTTNIKLEVDWTDVEEDEALENSKTLNTIFNAIDVQKKTIGPSQKELKELASTISSGEKEISPLNSKLENLIHSESWLEKNSTLRDEKIDFGEITNDEGTCLEDTNKRIPPKMIVIYGEKTEDLRLNHMSQYHAQHVAPIHRKNKKQPLICHHCGKYGHIKPYCFDWLKLTTRGRKEDHAKKKWKSNAAHGQR
ncbi:hypothetical protein KIW84_062845 [Lathyrus oleraceus]|uniref:CCHC-type domain-containing protein n=1 Tax=Pisum sativum TaxID=3888 RepID=A0A9D4W886_PEA|nr:hypothetical protein KIW84_062845 [Pisum sativum]